MARNIRVVEDDHNISDLIRMYLLKEGFEVRIADDGGKAIREFETKVPDLILLDGGRGHVSVVREALREAGVDIPVFGLVKDEHHKTRTVVGEEEEIGIARDTLVFPFLYKLQEEVHRFTVSGMSAAKRKTLRTSSLEKVKGIGPAKAKALLQHFGTLTNMRSASVSDIETVKGVSRSEAESVYEFLHKTTDE